MKRYLPSKKKNFQKEIFCLSATYTQNQKPKDGHLMLQQEMSHHVDSSFPFFLYKWIRTILFSYLLNYSHFLPFIKLSNTFYLDIVLTKLPFTFLITRNHAKQILLSNMLLYCKIPANTSYLLYKQGPRGSVYYSYLDSALVSKNKIFLLHFKVLLSTLVTDIGFYIYRYLKEATRSKCK